MRLHNVTFTKNIADVVVVSGALRLPRHISASVGHRLLYSHVPVYSRRVTLSRKN